MLMDQNQSKTAKSLMLVYKKAAVNAPVLAQLLQKVGKRSNAKIVSNFKNPETAVEKVDQKNDEEPGRDYKLQDINDIARGRLIFNSYSFCHQ
jgi:hypothetical protein